MKIAFFVAAAVMIAVALIALLLPLMRHGRQTKRPRAVFALALVIAFALPLTAALLYLQLGTPAALNGIAKQAKQPLDMQQALAELRTHLAQQPDDQNGWMLLAQTESMMGNATEALHAYDQVLKLDPDNVGAMVGWAQTDSTNHGDHMIEGRALELLQRAVLLQPTSQRGLWLLGISHFQHSRYQEAAATWRKLQPLLEPGSTVAQSVATQIAAADARAKGAPASASSTRGEPQTTGAAASATHDAALKVQVTLAPALKSKLAAGDTLFVYARSESGPPMPLAVARLDAGKLPATVTLTDAMAMTPALRLSSVARVFVGARISHSGQALAQPGDLEGNAGIVAVDSKAPIKITIDSVH